MARLSETCVSPESSRLIEKPGFIAVLFLDSHNVLAHSLNAFAVNNSSLSRESEK